MCVVSTGARAGRPLGAAVTQPQREGVRPGHDVPAKGSRRRGSGSESVASGGRMLPGVGARAQAKGALLGAALLFGPATRAEPGVLRAEFRMRKGEEGALAVRLAAARGGARLLQIRPVRGGAHALLRNDLHREERVARSCCVRRGGICHRRRGSPGGLKGGGLFQFFTPGDVFFGGFRVYTYFNLPVYKHTKNS